MKRANDQDLWYDTAVTYYNRKKACNCAEDAHGRNLTKSVFCHNIGVNSDKNWKKQKGDIRK